MKNRRFNFGYRKSASKLHRAVGDCIRSSEVLSGFNVYQEYPVNKIDPSYHSGREKFDWVLSTIKVVIECHGLQHYKPVTFGSGSKEAHESFSDQIIRDTLKKDAAIRMGYTYVVVPHTDENKITEEYLLNLIKENENKTAPQLIHPSTKVDFKSAYRQKKKRDEDSGRAAARREKARSIRKEQYAKRKQWLAKRRNKDGGLNESK